MTKEEFFDELARIDGWEINEDGLVRKYHRDAQKKVVHCDCPITAVANKRIGHNEYTPGFFDTAACGLGLDNETALGVMWAADNWEGLRIPRSELLMACGLEEVA
jgi:hypothetical protein